MDSFVLTLSKIRQILNSRRSPNIDNIWVQGTNASTARLVFTIFYNNLGRSYEMRFLDIKNFRHFRTDGDPENELRLLNGYVSQISKVLGDVII